MKLKKSTLNIFFSTICLLNTSFLFSQQESIYIPRTSPAVSMNTEPSRLMVDRALWKEVASKRTWFSSTYVKPDSLIVIEYSKLPINYMNTTSKKLDPIDLIPSKTAEGDLYASKQICTVTLKRNGSVIIKTLTNTEIVYSNNVKINGMSVKSSSFTEQDTTHAVLSEILPGIDKVYDLKLSSVKYNYLLKKSLKLAGDLVIEEEIILPKGANMKASSNGIKTKKGWEGDISVFSNDHTEIGKIFRAQCYDAKGNGCVAAYEFENVGGVQKLKITVPGSWINDASRVYPITVDPLVTGPLATYGGVEIPSCEAPVNYFDSILVTIPSNITVTGFFVSGSYTTRNGALGKHGSNLFKTKCGQSGPFTIPFSSDPINPYNVPATGFLDAFELRAPLTCCIPQSCNTQTLYLYMGVSRTYTTALIPGCHDVYVFHDPFYFDTRTNFKCYVEGHTNEQGLATASWKVVPPNLCSNTCSVTATIYIKYGVPPYTITHPWASKAYTVGIAAGCSTGFTSKSFTLAVPDCPTYCTSASSLVVPTPTVLDACGSNVVAGLVPVTLTITPTPTVSAFPNPSIVCSDIPFDISLNSCIPSSTISWSGNSGSADGNILHDTITNNTGAVSSTTYIVVANNKGCLSAPFNLIVNTDPKVVAKYIVGPDPSLAKLPSTFTDESSTIGSVATKWRWSLSSASTPFSIDPTAYFIFESPGDYNVCLAVETQDGCRDTICKDIKVITANITLPNVITPNGDGANDVLKINYLDFFKTNNLKIYDRWGRLMYEKQDYDNTWNGDKVTDGTYFLVMVVDDKSYSGFLQVFHK